MSGEALSRDEIYAARKANAQLLQQRENEQRCRKQGFSDICEIVGDAQKPDISPRLPSKKEKPRKRGKKNTGFGKLYRCIFETPEYCQLNWRDHHIYVYLMGCRNNATGIASPGYENILEHLSHCKPNRTRPFDIQSVSRAIRSLEKLGLCRRVSKAYAGHATEIWVAVKAEDVER